MSYEVVRFVKAVNAKTIAAKLSIVIRNNIARDYHFHITIDSFESKRFITYF